MRRDSTPPARRFREWRHPSVEASLRARDARGLSAVATQARWLLIASVVAPLLARVVRATVWSSAAFALAVDVLAALGAALATYRLVPLVLSGRALAAREASLERTRRANALSPNQRRLLGEERRGDEQRDLDASRARRDGLSPRDASPRGDAWSSARAYGDAPGSSARLRRGGRDERFADFDRIDRRGRDDDYEYSPPPFSGLGPLGGGRIVGTSPGTPGTLGTSPGRVGDPRAGMGTGTPGTGTPGGDGGARSSARGFGFGALGLGAAFGLGSNRSASKAISAIRGSPASPLARSGGARRGGFDDGGGDGDGVAADILARVDDDFDLAEGREPPSGLAPGSHPGRGGGFGGWPGSSPGRFPGGANDEPFGGASRGAFGGSLRSPFDGGAAATPRGTGGGPSRGSRGDSPYGGSRGSLGSLGSLRSRDSPGPYGAPGSASREDFDGARGGVGTPAGTLGTPAGTPPLARRSSRLKPPTPTGEAPPAPSEPYDGGPRSTPAAASPNEASPSEPTPRERARGGGGGGGGGGGSGGAFPSGTSPGGSADPRGFAGEDEPPASSSRVFGIGAGSAGRTPGSAAASDHDHDHNRGRGRGRGIGGFDRRAPGGFDSAGGGAPHEGPRRSPRLAPRGASSPLGDERDDRDDRRRSPGFGFDSGRGSIPLDASGGGFSSSGGGVGSAFPSSGGDAFGGSPSGPRASARASPRERAEARVFAALSSPGGPRGRTARLDDHSRGGYGYGYGYGTSPPSGSPRHIHLPPAPPPVDVWTDRFREWVAFRLLKPLAALVETSHARVNDALGALGESSVVVSPLCDFEGRSSDARTSALIERDWGLLDAARERLELAHAHANRAAEEARRNAAAPAFGGGGSSLFGGGGGGFGGFGGGFGGGAPRPQPGAPSPASASALAEKERHASALLEALEAVTAHLGLVALFRGELPGGLIPATPPGYAARRAVELAQGTCVGEFAHDSGGAWGDRAWSPELPSDAQLLLYLFCGFLERPGWRFDVVDGGVFGGGGGGGERFKGVQGSPAAAASPHHHRGHHPLGGVGVGVGVGVGSPLSPGVGVGVGGALDPAAGSSASPLSSSGGAPLHFARPPPPHVERYVAVLASRPPAPPGVGALALVMPRSAGGGFALFADGGVAHAFEGPHAVFRAVVALLAHARERHGGVLGRCRMAAADVALESVFAPGRML